MHEPPDPMGVAILLAINNLVCFSIGCMTAAIFYM